MIDLIGMGFNELVCVTPPGAKISALSNLRAEDCGKVPGILGADKSWIGYDWRQAPTASQLALSNWRGDGANIGMRANTFPAVDVDCTDADLAQLLEGLTLTYLGPAPKRIGRSPKALFIYRTREPFKRMRLWIQTGATKHLIEILGDGQQYVVEGMHPNTGKPYAWPWPLIDSSQIVEITRDEADAFLETVQNTLEAFGYVCRREGMGQVTAGQPAQIQSTLRGEFAKIEAAMSFIPNTEERFPGRDDYLRMGYALKAACGDEGFDLFVNWAMDWPAAEYETVVSDWARMQPPYQVGAQWILEIAAEQGYDWAADEFQGEEAPPEEIEQLAKPTAAPPPPPSIKDAAPIKFTESALAVIFAKRNFQRARFCHERGGWFCWQNGIWEKSARMVQFWAGKLLDDQASKAYAEIADVRLANAVTQRLGSNSSRKSVVEYASVKPLMQAEPNDFDRNPWLLNTPGGLVDLRTGELREHDPLELCTRMTTVTPANGESPIWDKFLKVTTGGDVELELYLQRLAGYALTGVKTEHNLAFMYGEGGNGKGTFLGALGEIWGGYARNAQMDTFTSTKYDRHPTDVATLAGARLVTAQETTEGRNWDEAKIKTLSSADKVTARFMGRDPFEFYATFKLIFAGNNKPGIQKVDDAMRRRFHLVPFIQRPAHADGDLPEKLRAEYPQILQWCVNGARLWREHGLSAPAAVVDLTAEYFDEQDEFGSWLATCTRRDINVHFTPASAFYEAWRQHCGSLNMPAGTSKAFTSQLIAHGWERARSTGGERGFKNRVLVDYAGSEFTADL